MKKKIVIAIDGVSGAGKSTLARALAQALGFSYLDTGAMYRALTFRALERRADFSSPRALFASVQTCRLRLSPDGRRVWVGGKEVTRQIRGMKVSQHVSILASVPAIRRWMVRLQRAIAKKHSVVMEGRDIGTVVFPKADVKFFLTASLEERAKRRLEEIHGMGSKATLEAIFKNLADRDARDSGRETSPLRQASDAILIDSSALSVEEKTRIALGHVRRVMGLS